MGQDQESKLGGLPNQEMQNFYSLSGQEAGTQIID